MFQDHILSGLLFGIGILVHSRTAAFYTALGALLPLPLATLYGIDSSIINLELMGYNGVLCAIALGETNWRSFGWASVSVCVCDITNHRNELAYHHADCSVCSVGMDDTGFKKIVKQKGA